MKKINRYLSFLLVLSMMLCSTFLFTVSTAETENEDIAVGVTGNPGSENELQPMAASGCYYHAGKPYVPDGANLVREDEGANTSTAFLTYASGLGYVNGTWRYRMETWGMGYDTYECHYWYNSAYPGVYFYHS